MLIAPAVHDSEASVEIKVGDAVRMRGGKQRMTVKEVLVAGYVRCEYTNAKGDNRPKLCMIFRVDDLAVNPERAAIDDADR